MISERFNVDTRWIENSMDFTDNTLGYAFAASAVVVFIFGLVILFICMAGAVSDNGIKGGLRYCFTDRGCSFHSFCKSITIIVVVAGIASAALIAYSNDYVEKNGYATYRFTCDEEGWINNCDISGVDPVKSLNSVYIIADEDNLKIENNLDIDKIEKLMEGR